MLRDPYTAKPYVLFYTTKRVGGGVQDFDAIKVMEVRGELTIERAKAHLIVINRAGAHKRVYARLRCAIAP